jgi:hypothetical protein
MGDNYSCCDEGSMNCTTPAGANKCGANGCPSGSVCVNGTCTDYCGNRCPRGQQCFGANRCG